MTTTLRSLNRTVGSWVLALVATTTQVAAQPSITAISRPAPNALGWNNSPVEISYTCRGVASCPDPRTIATDGLRQLVSQSVSDVAGRTATVATQVNIDQAPALLTLLAPARDSSTSAAAAKLRAWTRDAGSGVSTATCNGVPAPIKNDEISCVVGLHDGVNDLVVQVSDRAGNSVSTGVQVRRVGRVSSITTVPDWIALNIGKTQPIQALDNFGRTIANAKWTVADPTVASLDRRTGVLSGLQPGSTTVTATYKGMTTAATVVVRPGTETPPYSVTWIAHPWRGFSDDDTSVSGVIHLHDFGPGTPSVMAIEHEIDSARVLLRAFDQKAARQLWLETPAIAPTEHMTGRRAGDPLGAGLLLVESVGGRSNTIVRVGRPVEGTVWRYSPLGRIGRAFAIYNGVVYLVEEGTDGYPVFAAVDEGRAAATFRIPLPRSSVVEPDGVSAGGRRDRPADVGMTPTVLLTAVHLAFSTVEDIDDAVPDVGGGLSRRRTIQHMQIEFDGSASYRTVHQYALKPGETVDVTISPVLPDGHGGQLVAWVALRDGQPPEYMVVRVIEGRLIPYQLPVLAAGNMVIGTDNMGATTDGRTLVAFDVTDGKVLWTYGAPEGGFFRDLLALDGARLNVSTERGLERFDRAGGRRLLAPPVK